MKKSKKKLNKWKAIAMIELFVIIAGSIFGIYNLYIKDSPTFQFVGRVLKPEEGGVSILKRRVETQKPYNLTNNQKYYKGLVDEKNINVLVIGPDESGANYDTLMIASVNEESNTLKLINLPRDIYIDYSDEVKSQLKKVWKSYSSSKGIYKINAAHTIGKKLDYKDGSGRFSSPEFDFTADLIEEIFGIYIDDFAYIKPSSFKRVVDYFGGVEINVPYRMKYKDPTQDLTIDLDAGLQTLNGAQAEGFVRYRQGVDEKGRYKSIGDIERKQNQVTFVKAFLDQHMTIRNLGKIITIFDDLGSYITSSINNAEEAGEYGKVAKKLYDNKFATESEEIECSDKKIGGVYYLEIKKTD